MHKYPTVITTVQHAILVGTPIRMNVPTSRYFSPTLFVNPIAVTFGNPEVGKPIAQEQIKAVAKTRILGCGSGRARPISAINGTMINAATVWDTNVAIIKTMKPKTAKMVNISEFFSFCWISCAIVASNPETVTALPKARPPIAKITIVHAWIVIKVFLG